MSENTFNHTFSVVEFFFNIFLKELHTLPIKADPSDGEGTKFSKSFPEFLKWSVKGAAISAVPAQRTKNISEILRSKFVPTSSPRSRSRILISDLVGLTCIIFKHNHLYVFEKNQKFQKKFQSFAEISI